MANKVLEGVQIDACLSQEQRHHFSKQLSSTVWMIKVDNSTTKEDEDHAHVAGVCISPLGHILTSSHVIKSDLKYVGSCPSWKAGWTPLKVAKRSMNYGLSLLQVEGQNRNADYTCLAESGILKVNQHVYGFGHPNMFQLACTNTVVRGSVEYPCEDITELPACFNDLDHPSTPSFDDSDSSTLSELKFDMKKALVPSPRLVRHLKCAINLETFHPTTILLMHQDIPLVQIKNFHLGYCGGPVFVSSGHLVGIILFKLHAINFAVHLSAIKEFLKDVDLTYIHVNEASSC